MSISHSVLLFIRASLILYVAPPPISGSLGAYFQMNFFVSRELPQTF